MLIILLRDEKTRTTETLTPMNPVAHAAEEARRRHRGVRESAGICSPQRPTAAIAARKVGRGCGSAGRGACGGSRRRQRRLVAGGGLEASPRPRCAASGNPYLVDLLLGAGARPGGRACRPDRASHRSRRASSTRGLGETSATRSAQRDGGAGPNDRRHHGRATRRPNLTLRAGKTGRSAVPRDEPSPTSHLIGLESSRGLLDVRRRGRESVARITSRPSRER